MSYRKTLRAAAVALAVASAPGLALGQGLGDPIPDAIPATAPVVALVVVADGMTAPNGGTYAPGLPGYLFVTDQDGILWAVNLSDGTKSVFLDVSNLIVALGARPALGLDFDERGLVGLAFHPDFQHNGKFYTYTSEPSRGAPDFSTMPPGTTANHQSVIREWRARRPANPAAGITTLRGRNGRVLLRVDQPQFNHNSGAIAFDDTGMLLITMGDGGGADDEADISQEDFIGVTIVGHGVVGNGQNPGNVLGTLMRIDVDGNNSANGQYGIPADNPFYVTNAGQAGGQQGCLDGTCDEIYAFGFRNPFRMSVDMGSGAVILGDVGQNDLEEVDIVVAAGNYGWRVKEGTFFFNNNGAGAGFVSQNSAGQPETMIDPVGQYDHDEGVAVLAGHVYRGGAMASLEGRFIFGEFIKPPFNPFNVICDGRLLMLDTDFNRAKADIEADVRSNSLASNVQEFPNNLLAGNCVLGLGQDANGEVYVMTSETGVPQGSTGKVWKIVPAE